MSTTKQQCVAKGMRWAARVIGVVITTFFLMFLVGEAVTSIQAEGFKFDIESLFVVVPAVIALAGCILSWWRERVGGSLLILVSFAFGILPSVGAQWSMLQALQGWLILGSPFLVAGVLFLLSSWLTRKASLQE